MQISPCAGRQYQHMGLQRLSRMDALMHARSLARTHARSLARSHARANGRINTHKITAGPTCSSQQFARTFVIVMV